MKFNKFKITHYLIIGFIGALTLLVISFILNTFPIPTYFAENNWISFRAASVDLRGQLESAGNINIVGETFTNLLAFFQLNPQMILNIILGAIIIAIIGRIIVGYIPNIKGNLRALLSFFFGMLLLGIILSASMKIDFISSFLSAGLLGLILGITVQLIILVKPLRYLVE